jgi:PAS domain S-box-containing protein
MTAARATRMAAVPRIYFEKLLESSPDIVVAVDRHGTIVFYNDGARKTLGYTHDEIFGKHVTLLYPSLAEAKKVMAAMRHALPDARGTVKNYETTFRTSSGEQVPVAISGSIIYDADGRESGSIGFAKDFREIRRRDQLATLGEIALGLAHEINNPLEVILNNVSLLRRSLEQHLSDDDLVVESERIDSIDEELRKVQSIVNRIGEMAVGGVYGTREYLPGTRMADLSTHAESRRSARPHDGPPLRPGLRILVVDDDLGICHSLRDLLRGEGCTVDIATSATEALRRLAEHRADLVLSDVVMPDADGYDLLLQVRERYPEVPVVLMTAFFYDRDHVIKRSRMRGLLNGVLYKKPIDLGQLREIIRTHCPTAADTSTASRRPQPA